MSRYETGEKKFEQLNMRISGMIKRLVKLAIPHMSFKVQARIEHVKLKGGFKTDGNMIYVSPRENRDEFYFNLMCGAAEAIQYLVSGIKDRTSDTFFGILDKLVATSVYYSILPDNKSQSTMIFTEYERKYGKVRIRFTNKEVFDDMVLIVVKEEAAKYNGELLRKQGYAHSGTCMHFEKRRELAYLDEETSFLNEHGIPYQIKDTLYLKFMSSIAIWGAVPSDFREKLIEMGFWYNNQFEIPKQKYRLRVPIEELDNYKKGILAEALKIPNVKASVDI